MVEVVKCERGHFYDKSQFVRCPHCEAGRGAVRKTTGYRNEVSKYAAEYLEEKRGEKRQPQEESISQKEYESFSRKEPQDEEKKISDSQGKVPEDGQESILRRTPDDGKGARTIGFSPSNQRNYAVAGWLVCIDGPHKGYSFNLYYGYNTIGRSRNNRVCLLEDTSVAGKVHCSIVYEDRKNCFYLVPQENQETYLNDQGVTGVSNLKNEDRIKVGKSQFVFIAFCGGERKWEKELMRKAAKY